FLGIGDEYRALPWSVLRYNENLDAYELNVTEAQLRNAPVLAAGWDTGAIGRDWERNIHDYYRASPYWYSLTIERGTAGAASSRSTTLDKCQFNGIDTR